MLWSLPLLKSRMRHRKVGKILGRPKAQRESLRKNLATSVILYEKVVTTQAKAKWIRSSVEKAITWGKKPTLANRRQLMRFFPTEAPVKKILDVIAPRYASRPGGYTRLIKQGARVNDGSSMVQIELV